MQARTFTTKLYEPKEYEIQKDVKEDFHLTSKKSLKLPPLGPKNLTKRCFLALFFAPWLRRHPNAPQNLKNGLKMYPILSKNNKKGKETPKK